MNYKKDRKTPAFSILCKSSLSRHGNVFSRWFCGGVISAGNDHLLLGAPTFGAVRVCNPSHLSLRATGRSWVFWKLHLGKHHTMRFLANVNMFQVRASSKNDVQYRDTDVTQMPRARQCNEYMLTSDTDQRVVESRRELGKLACCSALVSGIGMKLTKALMHITRRVKTTSKDPSTSREQQQQQQQQYGRRHTVHLENHGRRHTVHLENHISELGPNQFNRAVPTRSTWSPGSKSENFFIDVQEFRCQGLETELVDGFLTTTLCSTEL